MSTMKKKKPGKMTARIEFQARKKSAIDALGKLEKIFGTDVLASAMNRKLQVIRQLQRANATLDKLRAEVEALRKAGFK